MMYILKRTFESRNRKTEISACLDSRLFIVLQIMHFSPESTVVSGEEVNHSHTAN